MAIESRIERQVEVYKRTLDDAGKPFPDEFPMMREAFVASHAAQQWH